MIRNTKAIIDTDSLLHNIHQARRSVGTDVKLLAVIKANAYGHGIVEVGRFLEQSNEVDFFAVAIPEEGIKLRQNGITLPILILGATDDDHLCAVVQYSLTPAVFSLHTLRRLQAEAKNQNKQVPIHIKIDSGMHRIGIGSIRDFEDFLDELNNCPSIVAEGIFTHFAKADEDDFSYTDKQFAAFGEYVNAAKKRGLRPIVHCCNSGGIFLHPQYACDMVRLGISLYGSHVNARLEKDYPLKPVMRFSTNIVNLFTLKQGEGLSYNLRFVADRDITVATLPVGYGDGYKRCLTNKAKVLIGGRLCHQIGTICMDQMMVDVSGVQRVAIGDEAVLIGSQGGQSITSDDMASWADTISYEILLSISDRVPRLYI